MREWLVRLLGGFPIQEVSEESEVSYLRRELLDAHAENRRLINLILARDGYITTKQHEETKPDLKPIGGRHTWLATKARLERSEAVTTERPPESIETEKRWAGKVNAS